MLANVVDKSDIKAVISNSLGFGFKGHNNSISWINVFT
jgi:3-oxoacyl-(acyl-carrier-protein) synthase